MVSVGPARSPPLMDERDTAIFYLFYDFFDFFPSFKFVDDYSNETKPKYLNLISLSSLFLQCISISTFRLPDFSHKKMRDQTSIRLNAHQQIV